MSAYIDLHDPVEGLAPGDVSVIVADHLRDVRRLKRLTQAGVYFSLAASLPFFYFVAGMSLYQTLAVLIVGLAIATGAIEGAFIQMFRLRKRSAYPGAVALHLGSLPGFDVGCHNAGDLLRKLLHVRSSFLTLQDESGFLNLVALNGISRLAAERYLRLGASCVQHALSTRDVAALRSNSLSSNIVTPRGSQVVFVPVQSFQRLIGIVGLLADESNGDLRDAELLADLGRAIGVSLESLRQRDELRTMAAIDELTRVHNRRYFFEQLDRELAAAGRYEMPASVVILDLDGLKRLNDTFGHEAGDEALRTVAQRLVRYARASDIVARLGGDEFAVILPRTDGDGTARIVHRIQELIEREPVAAPDGSAVAVGISCGYASFPGDADDASLLLRTADGRMYAAKAARRLGTDQD